MSDRASKRRAALLDIGIVALVSIAAYWAEGAARDAGLVSWGDEARGAAAVLAGTATAVALVLARGDSLRDLGFRRPSPWWSVPLWTIGILVAYIAAQVAVPALLSPIVDIPEPDLSRYDAIRGNLSAAVAMAVVLPLTASIPEELFYRGFLIGRLTSIVGAGRAGAIAAVLIQALLFGAVHFQWGLGGVVVTAIMGTVWGAAYLLCGRNLWIVIIAHSTGHLLMVAQLYLAPTPT